MVHRSAGRRGKGIKMITDCGAARLLVAIAPGMRDRVKQVLNVTDLSIDNYRSCARCGKRISPRNKTGYCNECNNKCRHELSFIAISCAECGRLFRRRACEIVWHLNHAHSITGKPNERIFCSRKCLGKWRGRNHGFKVHPENRGRTRIHDWQFIWRKHLDTGYGALRLSRLLKIPESAIAKILRKERISRTTDGQGHPVRTG